MSDTQAATDAIPKAVGIDLALQKLNSNTALQPRLQCRRCIPMPCKDCKHRQDQLESIRPTEYIPIRLQP